jgi:hypothetical protein
MLLQIIIVVGMSLLWLNRNREHVHCGKNGIVDNFKKKAGDLFTLFYSFAYLTMYCKTGRNKEGCIG